ncbi:membrane subunit of NADH:quinone oxidoreductase/Mrp antiporter [Phlyctochytrium arcticum]|nr:membrane subunit of NADH:quinone oxidoreductase/Mrp antiporter [Phlyctochytrium arcticum]
MAFYAILSHFSLMALAFLHLLFVLSCLAQIDLKKIIAYSSIGHMSTATIALFTNDFNGISAGVYFLLSHGIISSALFLLIGVLYDRYHTRTLKYYRGLVMVLPVFTLLFFLFTLANIAVPGTSGFISEFLTF